MISKVYEALENDVYNEKFLKPLMLSLEYEDRESTNNSFYELDNRLHMDHILPRAYNQKDEWKHINLEDVAEEINGLGNMALLQDIKNEEALNCGWDNKVRIYKGLDEEGNNKSGITAFELTRKVLENTEWNIQQILDRKRYLIKKIEKMLEIKKEDVNQKLPEESSNGKSGKSKWLYNGIYYDNAKLVRALIHDYIVQNNIRKYEDIPEEIRNFKMLSHELIIQGDNELIKTYSYTKVDANGMEIYIRSICKKDNTTHFLEIMNNYFSFKLESTKFIEEE